MLSKVTCSLCDVITLNYRHVVSIQNLFAFLTYTGSYKSKDKYEKYICHMFSNNADDSDIF